MLQGRKRLLAVERRGRCDDKPIDLGRGHQGLEIVVTGKSSLLGRRAPRGRGLDDMLEDNTIDLPRGADMPLTD
jgi:hypothetical protein